MKPRLAIISTHPIQYYAPLFRQLATDGQVELMVFYTWSQAQTPRHDPDFGKTVAWDVPLLDGYAYTFVENTAANPGSSHFRGICNPSLIAELEAWKPDALLVFGWSYQSHLQVLRHFKNRLPVFFRGDSHLLNEQKGLKTLLRRIALTWIYRHIDIALYVGENNKQYFLKHGLKPHQLIFAPHVIDNKRFAADEQQRTRQAQEWRRSLQIGDNEMVFLYCGKLIPRKNTLILMEAFQKNPLPGCHLVFVGNGELEQEMKQKAGEKVHFIDFQNQTAMPVIYRIGDVLVLPSIVETWGLVVNEAMACGRAILASNLLGCATDLVKPGINGEIFQFDDPGDLADKLHRLAAHPQRGQLGENSRRMIADWTIERLAAIIADAIMQSKNHQTESRGLQQG